LRFLPEPEACFPGFGGGLVLKQAKVSLFFVEFFFAHPDWSRLGWVGFRVVNRAWRFILSVGF
jgi:hypothetical protein